MEKIVNEINIYVGEALAKRMTELMLKFKENYSYSNLDDEILCEIVYFTLHQEFIAKYNEIYAV